MKYCRYCGTKLNDDANFCSRCAKPTSQAQKEPHKTQTTTKTHSNQELINTLSSRLNMCGIIWIVVASLQILIGLCGAWFTLIVGVLNIISAIKDIQSSKNILTNPNGIVAAHEPLTNPIIVLVYNILIGGIFGVAGSIYYLIFVRGFIMENKAQFLAMETDTPNQNQGAAENNTTTPSSTTFANSTPTHNTAPTANSTPTETKTTTFSDWFTPAEPQVNIEVTLTPQEALNGVQKDVNIPELNQPLKVNFPRNVENGNRIILRNVNVTTNDGRAQKKDLYVKVVIKNP